MGLRKKHKPANSMVLTFSSSFFVRFNTKQLCRSCGRTIEVCHPGRMIAFSIALYLMLRVTLFVMIYIGLPKWILMLVLLIHHGILVLYLFFGGNLYQWEPAMNHEHFVRDSAFNINTQINQQLR